MPNIDPQTTQQIVQLLATYGAPAGIAAAQAAGTNLGNGATQAVKSLWGKLRNRSKQEGGMAQKAIMEFETTPNEVEHQHTLAFIIKQLCKEDVTLTQEILKLFEEIQRDPIASQYILHISGSSQVGMIGPNYGTQHINQTYQQTGSVRPLYELKIEFSYSYIHQFETQTALCVSAINVGTMPSYVSSVNFEHNVDGQPKVNGLFDHGKSQIAHRFGEAIQPGQKHKYLYILQDLSTFVELGNEVIPIAVIVIDEIGNKYRQPFSEQMSETLTHYYIKYSSHTLK